MGATIRKGQKKHESSWLSSLSPCLWFGFFLNSCGKMAGSIAHLHSASVFIHMTIERHKIKWDGEKHTHYFLASNPNKVKYLDSFV